MGVGIRNSVALPLATLSKRSVLASGGFAPDLLEVVRANTSGQAQKPDIASQFLALLLTLGLFGSALGVYVAKGGHLPHVSASLFPSLSDSSPTYSVRDAAMERSRLLSRLSAPERIEFQNQVHYVNDRIRGMRRSQDESRQLATLVVLESRKAQIDPLYVASVIRHESRFNRHAMSSAGALGLMQLLPSTARYISSRTNTPWLGDARLRDPVYNIKLGIAYLKYLDKRFGGNKEHVLIAYNWGPGNLFKAFKREKAIPSCTVKYARGVLGTHRQWRNEYTVRVAGLQGGGVIDRVA